jgi:hypothetical protein
VCPQRFSNGSPKVRDSRHINFSPLQFLLLLSLLCSCVRIVGRDCSTQHILLLHILIYTVEILLYYSKPYISFMFLLVLLAYC